MPKFFLMLWIGTLAAVRAFAATPDAGYHRPVPVEVLSYVDVNSSHPGSRFYVKLIGPWEGLGCYFYDGQVLQGTVDLASRRGKGQRESQLAISFPNMRCAGNKSTMNLVLAAMEWDAGMDKLPDSQYPSVVTIANPRIGSSGFSMDGMTMMAMNQRPKNQVPLKAGDVLGMDGVTLEIGKGPERSSLLKSTKGNVHLEKESMMLLIPETVAFSKGHEADGASLLGDTAVAGSPAPRSMANANISLKAAPLPPPEEFEPCQPPACAVDLPSSDRDTRGTPSKSIGIRALGYAPRPEQQLGELTYDEALAWLGPHQLLIAFNPHTLIDRTTGQTSVGMALRRIHAVVVDPATSKMLSSADWFLPDMGEFMWQLARDRVLIHVGNELRVYGEGMQIERQIPLDGPLKFVRLSPNGELMAIAVARETHTPEQHAALRESLNTEPPENVEIRVFDKDFKAISEATTSSKIIPPTLLNEGQVQLLGKLKTHFVLKLARWNGEPVTVARFSSACIPDVSSFAPDLLMVASCEVGTGAHEYRVLRPNGKVLLRGRPDPQIASQSGQGNGQCFAVKNLHAIQSMLRGAHFQGSDLDYEVVRVFQSRDGRQLTSVRLQTPPPSHGAFALSPDGAQLAVIADAKVNLFSVPAQ
jgi:hypothetical protein